MTETILRISTLGPVPIDVLLEHIAVAMKNLLKARPDSERGFTVQEIAKDGHIGRNHPFDGPAVFDDERPAPYDLFAAGGVIEADPDIQDHPSIVYGTEYLVPKDSLAGTINLPRLQELFNDKRTRQLKRPLEGPVEPMAEGDWELDADDRVGED